MLLDTLRAALHVLQRDSNCRNTLCRMSRQSDMLWSAWSWTGACTWHQLQQHSSTSGTAGWVSHALKAQPARCLQNCVACAIPVCLCSTCVFACMAAGLAGAGLGLDNCFGLWQQHNQVQSHSRHPYSQHAAICIATPASVWRRLMQLAWLQALQELASVLVPSLTSILGSGSSAANLSLTSAATIANTLHSAVQGVNTSANSAAQVPARFLTGHCTCPWTYSVRACTC